VTTWGLIARYFATSLQITSLFHVKFKEFFLESNRRILGLVPGKLDKSIDEDAEAGAEFIFRRRGGEFIGDSSFGYPSSRVLNNTRVIGEHRRIHLLSPFVVYLHLVIENACDYSSNSFPLKNLSKC